MRAGSNGLELRVLNPFDYVISAKSGESLVEFISWQSATLDHLRDCSWLYAD